MVSNDLSEFFKFHSLYILLEFQLLYQERRFGIPSKGIIFGEFEIPPNINLNLGKEVGLQSQICSTWSTKTQENSKVFTSKNKYSAQSTQTLKVLKRNLSIKLIFQQICSIKSYPIYIRRRIERLQCGLEVGYHLNQIIITPNNFGASHLQDL